MNHFYELKLNNNFSFTVDWEELLCEIWVYFLCLEIETNHKNDFLSEVANIVANSEWFFTTQNTSPNWNAWPSA